MTKLVHIPTGATIKEIEDFETTESGVMMVWVIATEPAFPIIPSSKGGRPMKVNDARVLVADLEIQEDFEQDVLLMGGPDLTADDEYDYSHEGPAVQ